MVAAAIFMFLTASLFVIFFVGARAWRMTDNRSDVLRAAQVVAGQIAREAERSTLSSLSVTADQRALSFLSAIDAAGNHAVDAVGDTRWQRYVIFYYDAANREVRRVDVPLVAGAPQIRYPEPIERYNDGLGARPLSAYLTGGRILSRDIEAFRVDLPPGGERVYVTVSTLKHDRRDPDVKLDLTTVVRFRN